MEAWGSCALDVADDGEVSDEMLARMYGMTAKEAGAMCDSAVRKLRHYGVSDVLGVFRQSS